LPNRLVVFKHAVRNAIQPIIMYLGWRCPFCSRRGRHQRRLEPAHDGSCFFAVVGHPGHVPRGLILMMLAVVLVIGNLLADIALVWVDPR
jgi:peptide/nickel transport system permease protein